HGALGGAIQIAEDFRMLEKIALAHLLEETLTAGEMVVDAIHLAGAHGPGGMGNRYPQRVDLLDQRRDQAGLARTGRGGNDIESTGGLAHGGYCPGLRRGGIIKATAGGVMPTWPAGLVKRSSSGGGRPGLLLWRGILEVVDLTKGTERRRPATDHRQ